MLNENILNEMYQRKGERTGEFLKRQQMARNTIRKINALEVHLGFLLSDDVKPSRIGDTLNGKPKDRNNITSETREGIRSIA